MSHGDKTIQDRQFVRVRPDQTGGRQLFGLFLAEPGNEHGVGRVYDFQTRRFYQVAKANCSPVESYDITGGLLGVKVRVSDFGEGRVEKEWMSSSSYRARVVDGQKRSVVATITELTVVVPDER